MSTTMPDSVHSNSEAATPNTRRVGWWSHHLGRSVVIALVVAGVLGSLALFAAVYRGEAPDLTYRSLDYDVQMLDNGDLKIRQRVTVTLREREDGDGNAKPWRQLYQRYELNPDNLTGITDISVRDELTGKDYAQGEPIPIDQVSSTSDWDREQANHWYIANVDFDDYLSEYQPNDSVQTVEIGWNIPLTDEDASRTFDIDMTFEGVSTAHSDVTSFMWEPIGANNEVPVGTVNGVVRFPEGVDADNSWAWLHFSGVSRTWRDADGSLRFTASDVRAGQHLDVRVMVDASATSGVARVDNIRAKQFIMDEETQQETAAREAARTAARKRLAAWVAGVVLAVALGVLCIRAAYLTYRDSQYRGDLEYWRDPPQMSPASAAALYGFLEGASSDQICSRQLAASVLSLASRKAIAVYPGPVERYAGLDLLTADPSTVAQVGNGTRYDAWLASGTSTVAVLPVSFNARQSLALSQSENAALNLLITASRRIGAPVFDLSQLQANFAQWHKASEVQSRFTTAAANEFAMLGLTLSAGRGLVVWGSLELLLGVVALVAAVVVEPVAVWLGIGMIAMFIAVFSLCYGRRTALSERGQWFAGQVLGLKRYLCDFSAFKDRGVNDLVLWDQYLIYATSFGISERVLAELSKAYPQVTDQGWLDGYASNSLLYWTYRPWVFAGAATGGWSVPGGTAPGSFNANYGDLGGLLTSSFTSIQSTIEISVSSGGSSGGSFSSGGFSGGGGGSGGGSFGGR